MTDNSEKLDVLYAIYDIEESQVNIGNHDFISFSQISNRIPSIPSTSVETILRILQEDKLIILIDNELSDFKPSKPDEKYYVKSRIGHILWCLLNTKQISNYQNEKWNDDVADLKYLKILKQKPKRIINFQKIKDDPIFKEQINIYELDKDTGGLFSAIIDFLNKITLSQFQYTSIREIILGLFNRNRNYSEGVTIVAETGAGKSFAYQLPLILWILTKKIQTYQRLKTQGKNPYTNCSALLLFPRNVLAHDQMQGILNDLIQPINELIENYTMIDTTQRDFLKIKIAQDFGGKKLYKQRKEMFERDRPDIIVTHVESLKKRLYDPIAATYYKEGIDLVLYDEVHLYEGSYGGYISGLNARLTNLMISNSKGGLGAKAPFFVGMSATIDKPDKHCQKLFALSRKPKTIDDADDLKEERTVEHHIIIKPRLGRSSLGVLIDCISCLIHNRRDSLAESHENLEIKENLRKKSITFIDSLDGSSRLTYDLNDFEWFDFPNEFPKQRIRRRFPVFYKPNQKANENSDICDQCRSGLFISDCTYYKKGICWYFSNSTAESWHKPHQEIEYPVDSIRSKRITSQEISETKLGSDIYDHFIQHKVKAENHEFRIGGSNGERIDNLIATNSLEVGVDYEGISEIILYGNIASPASYKQRAGRGGREGDLEDGLVVMTVIQNTPLSNFYYKHFKRLVNPQMTPIKFEVRNPNIVKSQCFSAIFDYFSRNKIHLYTIRESQDPEEVERIIKTQYSKAIEILQEKNDLVFYLKNFLSKLDVNNDVIINEAIEEAHSILVKMTKKISLQSGEKMLIDCISLAVKGDTNLKIQLKEIFENEYDEYISKLENINQTKKQLENNLKNFKTFVSAELTNFDEFNKIIDEIKEKSI